MKSTFRIEYEILLRKLVSARKAAGITQHELAKRLDRPQSFISKYERRERRLDVIELVIICRALNIDIREILGMIEDYMDNEEEIAP